MNFAHATLADNGAYALTSSVGYATLTNTIILSLTAGGLYGTNIEADYSLCYGNGSRCRGGAICTNSYSGDPHFVGPAQGGFHIGEGW